MVKKPGVLRNRYTWAQPPAPPRKKTEYTLSFFLLRQQQRSSCWPWSRKRSWQGRLPHTPSCRPPGLQTRGGKGRNVLGETAPLAATTENRCLSEDSRSANCSAMHTADLLSTPGRPPQRKAKPFPNPCLQES